jgi:hypothetical protein
VALNLYRRHRKECEARRAEDSNSGEFAERTRGWKRCACVIFVSGTLAGRFSRKRTGATTWDEARAYAAAIQAVGNWSGQPAPAVPGTGRACDAGPHHYRESHQHVPRESRECADRPRDPPQVSDVHKTVDGLR